MTTAATVVSVRRTATVTVAETVVVTSRARTVAATVRRTVTVAGIAVGTSLARIAVGIVRPTVTVVAISRVTIVAGTARRMAIAIAVATSRATIVAVSVVVFSVGKNIFAGCVHGEKDEAAKRSPSLLTLLKSAQVP